MTVLLGICFGLGVALPFLFMLVPTLLPCDGCGQLASAEHIASRLQRLEWATRFRPIHIQALLLAASAPEADSDFLYSPESNFMGQAGALLTALSISPAGKSSEEVLAEFQKRGLVLASLLECPLEPGIDQRGSSPAGAPPSPGPGQNPPFPQAQACPGDLPGTPTVRTATYGIRSWLPRFLYFPYYPPR